MRKMMMMMRSAITSCLTWRRPAPHRGFGYGPIDARRHVAASPGEERCCDRAPAPAAGSPCSTGDTLRPPTDSAPPQVEAPPPHIEARPPAWSWSDGPVPRPLAAERVEETGRSAESSESSQTHLNASVHGQDSSRIIPDRLIPPHSG
ncbi:hypothetical protein F7725_024628 [Dissostichus mawsoni]|uniref:Uncharacterized protein n=1 Tax=Dissostichus mawsoni TaxID=36200 RepID=A0A7J5X8U4_DISMA|nr:hypothetical protein F7725_024628 [Dissostichus mawsoni]